MPFDFSPTETKTNTVADVLRRAKALIDAPEKWCKKTNQHGDARCIMAAINAQRSATVYAPQARAAEFIARAIEIKQGYGVIPDWNDAPERTHAEVMSAFDRAIALAEREGR